MWTLSAGVRMPVGSRVPVKGIGGKREAMTWSKPRSRRWRAKKSGDMVMTAECSPRARMSAQTSAMPVSQVASV